MNPNHHFVARVQELAKLDGYLARAMDGQTQVCLVTGSVGTGKTTLLAEFAQRAQAHNEALVVAIGRCDAYMGGSDPYLPFREVLSLVTGDIEDKLGHRALNDENRRRLKRFLGISGQVLVENGPDLVGTFVPTASIWLKVSGSAFKKTSWFQKLEALADLSANARPWEKGIEQAQIFEQYANVIDELARHAPIIIALDDLHWSDADSIALLFRLARRLTTARVLIIGAYRADELTPAPRGERHALEKAAGELQRYFGDVRIDLDATVALRGREFIDALLDAEPNRLDQEFRTQLYQQTGGHPLFTEELLESLHVRGDLARDDHGRLTAQQAINWRTLPARVEGALAERLERLEPDLLQTAELAAVQGETFLAEIVAAMQQVDPRALIRRLSGELQDKQRLVASVGVERVGAQRVSRYRFTHKLIPVFLYQGLDVVERTFLHEDVGNALETLYHGATDPIAGQLALHFERADLHERALPYLIRAGELATQTFAHAQASDYFSRALALVDESALRLDLLLRQESLLDLQGRRNAQRAALDELETLAGKDTESLLQAEIALRRAHFANNVADHAAACRWADRVIQRVRQGLKPAPPIDAGLADRGLEPTVAVLCAQAYLAGGDAWRRQGNAEQAMAQYEQALMLAGESGDKALGAHVRRRLGALAWSRGNHAVAMSLYTTALLLAREAGDRRSESDLLNNLGLVAQQRGEHVRTVDCYTQALAIKKSIGDRRGAAMVLSNLADAYAYVGLFDQARAHAAQAWAMAAEIEQPLICGLVAANLARAVAREGNLTEAQRHADDALGIVRSIDDRAGEAYTLTTLGQLALARDDVDAAAAHFAAALTLWEELDAPRDGLEARAGLALTHLRNGGAENLHAAVTHAHAIVAEFDANPVWEGGETTLDLDILLAAHDVLAAAGDPQAVSLLRAAQTLLVARADRIGDPAIRRAYLGNFSTHRKLEQLSAG